MEEPPLTGLVPLVRTVARALLPYLRKPFAFFGHSLGALIAFEVAREVRRENALSPVHLLVSGQPAPQIPLPDQPIHALPATEFVGQVSTRYRGIPDAVRQNAELMELVLPVLRADVAMYEGYVYSAEPPLDCRISAFGGLEDRSVRRESLAAWREQTLGSFSMRMFPGDHFFLHETHASFLRTIAQELAQGPIRPEGRHAT